MRRRRIVFVVADHRRSAWLGAEFGDQPEQMTGIGLLDRESVAAGDAVEQRLEIEALQYRDRRPLRLVGADRSAVSAAAQYRERLRDTGVGSTEMRRIGLVDLKKAGQSRRDLPGIVPACRESTGHKCRHAIADHAFNLRRRQRCATALAQHFVYRRVQVRHGVDQCAVKIEDEQEAVHCRYRCGICLALTLWQAGVCASSARTG